MTPLNVFEQLHDLDVVLTPYPDGTLRYKAPKGVLTPALFAGLRQHKAALLDLVEEFEERAAIMEYCCGGLSRADADAFAWQCLVEQEAMEVSL